MIPAHELEAFLSGYLGETEDHLSAARKKIEVLGSAGQGAARVPALRELFRALHTIKGLSAMVGVQPIVDIAHAMEDILRQADSSARILTGPSLEVLGKGLLAIDQRLAEVAQKKASVTPAPQSLLREIEALAHAAASLPPLEARLSLQDPVIDAQLSESERAQLAEGLAQNQAALRVDFHPSRQRTEAGVSITSVRQAIERICTLVKVVPLRLPATAGEAGGLCFALVVLTSAPIEAVASCAHSEPEQVVILARPQAAALPTPSAQREDEAPAPAAVAPEAAYVRVDIGRLDTVLDHLSSLFITRFNLEQQMAQLAAQGADVRALGLALQELRRQLRDMRVAVMGARMVSVAEVLSRAPLIARGAASQLGKQVELKMQAGDALVDKAVGERLLPAIVHLIRNAIDHGIEAPHAREAAGKPAMGGLGIRAWQEGSSWLCLSVQDDGGGIDVEALAKKAKRELPQNEVELLDLLAVPGLSAKEHATTNSGRGVGVDAVREIVRQQLRGDLQVQTARGEGTTFTIKVPVSLAIIDAFAFQSEGQRFAVPVSSVDAIVDMTSDSLTLAPRPSLARTPALLLHRGHETIPVVSVRDAIGQQPAKQTTKSLLPPKAIVVRRHGAALGFQVDRMLGQQEIVVRPLNDPLLQVTGISGATDMGDGWPTLVLDLYALYDEVLGLGGLA